MLCREGKTSVSIQGKTGPLHPSVSIHKPLCSVCLNVHLAWCVTEYLPTVDKHELWPIHTNLRTCKYTGQCTMCQMHTIINPGAQSNLSLYRGVVVTSRGHVPTSSAVYGVQCCYSSGQSCGSRILCFLHIRLANENRLFEDGTYQPVVSKLGIFEFADSLQVVDCAPVQCILQHRHCHRTMYVCHMTTSHELT